MLQSRMVFNHNTNCRPDSKVSDSPCIPTSRNLLNAFLHSNWNICSLGFCRGGVVRTSGGEPSEGGRQVARWFRGRGATSRGCHSTTRHRTNRAISAGRMGKPTGRGSKRDVKFGMLRMMSLLFCILILVYWLLYMYRSILFHVLVFKLKKYIHPCYVYICVCISMYTFRIDFKICTVTPQRMQSTY